MTFYPRSKRLEHMLDADFNLFAARLKEIMEDSLICKEKLDSEGVVSKECVLSYLRKERMPNGKTLMRICNYFNVSADWLLGFSDERKAIWT